MTDRRNRRSPNETGPRCALCGTTEAIEQHHVGGRNHAPSFTLPLCEAHHRDMTASLRASGVDMRHTPHRIERIARAWKALAVFQWQLAEELVKK
jgi:hypothetical protein